MMERYMVGTCDTCGELTRYDTQKEEFSHVDDTDCQGPIHE